MERTNQTKVCRESSRREKCEGERKIWGIDKGDKKIESIELKSVRRS